MNILIIGGGIYVRGDGYKNFGTILPAVLQAQKSKLVDKIFISTTNLSSTRKCIKIGQKLSRKIGVKPNFYYHNSPRNRKSYLEIAKELSPDLAIIATPDHTHCEIALNLIKRGIHCLVVKPMASNIRDAKKMLNAERKSKNVICQVEFHKRLDESNMLFKKMIEEDKLGKLQYSVVEYSQRKIIPELHFKKWVSKSNIFQYLGVHYVDLLYFLTGFYPAKVTAWGQKDYLKRKKINTWDSIQTVIEWKRKYGGKFVSTITTNWIDPNKSTAMSDQKINIVGTKGRFFADQKNRGVNYVSDYEGVHDYNPYFTSSYLDEDNKRYIFDGYGIKSVIRFIKDVKDFKSNKTSIKKLQKTRPSFKSSFISTLVSDAVKKSIKSGNKTISIKFYGN